MVLPITDVFRLGTFQEMSLAMNDVSINKARDWACIILSTAHEQRNQKWRKVMLLSRLLHAPFHHSLSSKSGEHRVSEFVRIADIKKNKKKYE